MSSHWPKTNGPNFVPAYQVSGTPYVTSSLEVGTTPIKISFPSATRWITVSMQDSADKQLRIGFTENGIDAAETRNYFLLQGVTTGDSEFYNQTPRLELRCKDLFIRSETGAIDKVSVLAGLSTVDAGEFPVLTGSTYLTASDGTILNKAQPRFKGVG